MREDEDIKSRIHHFLPLPNETPAGFWRVISEKIWMLLSEEG